MAKKTTTTTRYSYEPDYAVVPGETLQETIGALGIDQRELAARSGLSAKTINQIIKGLAPISHDTSIRLERVTGVPARMWNNLESNYREQLARLHEQERLQKHLEWLETIPVKELAKRGVIETRPNKAELLEAVLAFFGVASVEAWQEGWSAPQFAFRKSIAFEGKVGAMATWLRLGELEAQKIDCQPFDKGQFRNALDDIRTLTVHGSDVFVPQMHSLCASAGVAVALVPEIKGAPVSGAAKWLTPSKAMICLNLRGKRNDRFWFTFFHEAGHILNDSKKETYIDVGYQDDPRERQANHFAATILVPASFDRELPGLTTYAAVEAFASRIGIAPGIVVGRLQRQGIIEYSQFNGLKQRLEWAEEAGE
jgi:HTH-type transcriptional regulator / antitoxin HigA